jgi:ADP-ribose pyrophosphatase
MILVAGPDRSGTGGGPARIAANADRILARCDAPLRIGGAADGADRMVRVARGLGKTVDRDLDAVPSP